MRKKLRILQTKNISQRTESDFDKFANAETSSKIKKKQYFFEKHKYPETCLFVPLETNLGLRKQLSTRLFIRFM